MSRKRKDTRKKRTANNKKQDISKRSIKNWVYQSYSTDRCVNPFQFKGHVGSSLRKVSKSIRSKFPDLNPRAKICNKCRKHDDNLHLNIDNQGNNSSDEVNPPVEIDNRNSNDNENFSRENQPHDMNEMPAHVREEQEMLRPQEVSNTGENDYKIIYDKLKKKFSELENNDPLRVQILSLVPDHWSLQKTVDEFGTTMYYARKARELQKTEGVFGDVKKRQGHRLPNETIEKIQLFYNSDEVSRIMPGMKDTVSMKVNGVRQKVQKRALLSSLKELYITFKAEYPNERVGFSTFAKHRPKNCILPGQSGTHSVCVCTIHQNVKTMLDAIDLPKLTANEQNKLKDYKDCLKQMVCSKPTDKCFLDECNRCPSAETFCEMMRNLLEKASIDRIKYAVWTETDRATLYNIEECVDDYIDNLRTRLEKLKPHSFIVKKQSEFIKQRKLKLEPGIVMVGFDFSENYGYVAQDAAQAFHYNNDQSTVFPVIYYYNNGNGLVHKSAIFISECTTHDATAVYTVLNQLIPVIRKDVPRLRKIIYVSDGAKQHFKNRFQMANLKWHKQDFDVEAEWHFTPTAHGKGGHDGLAACFKREARRASLKAEPTEALLNIKSLYSLARQYYTDVKIFYFSKADHNCYRRKLNNRFENAQRVNGIMKNHCFRVLVNGELEMKRFSS